MTLRKNVSKILFFVTGVAALAWFLIRVIPKPSRAGYPCMRAAFPIASGFILYIAALVTSVFAYKQFRKNWALQRYWGFTLFFLIALVSAFTVIQGDNPQIFANPYQLAEQVPNQPLGIGKGIFPGRVVWVHDSDAVVQNLRNVTGDFWWQVDNSNQTIINNMVADAVKTMTGASSEAAAWDSIFIYYNRTHGRGNKGYTAGEKIVIKINLNTGASGNSYARSNNTTIDTSPQIVYAVLDQLINKAGIAQADIGFGDPGRNVDNIFWNNFHNTFPDVKYWGKVNGRTPIVQSANPQLITSDGQRQDYLPQCYLDAAYMINIPVFKQHHRAGISLCSKNHFGSFVPFLGDAFPLHYSLPSTQGDGNADNGEYNQYRIFVDFMGHKDIGGKTILYLIDGLWSSTNYGDPPWKWRMAPFNTQYPASVFASQDPVAIESVGFDFLYNEFYVGNPSHNAFPHYSGVDDFLHQAADSVNWPEGIKYDPEADGTCLPLSMGVHEHWNNAAEMKYSRNLHTGEGIELVRVEKGITSVNEDPVQKPAGFMLDYNYPNPFNSSTRIKYYVTSGTNARHISLKIFDMLGNEIATLVDSFKPAGIYESDFNSSMLHQSLTSGVYFYRLQSDNFSETRKMVLLR